ncbi:hypothetical protein [Methanobacterium oryzae]|uniref:hypothetical protein n=1 Tax=Methanobacterium oryzae TaxID=69540 RepID=UPI003D1F4838
MTLSDDLISKIADKDVDINEFAKLIINDAPKKDEIVNLMLNSDKIMVYYHSYYILSKASEIKPDLFYKYWNDFISLLHHENSYHRNFGLSLIANLTEIDEENRFFNIFDDYFKHLNDVKFMTAMHCVENTAKIIKNKDCLKEDIINILLDVDKLCIFPKKQKALLKSGIIEIFDEFYEELGNKDKINEFVKNELDSISPKTKKMAKNFILKYEL